MQAIKVIDGSTIKEIPINMLIPFEKLIVEQYGRSIKQLAAHRGLTVKEAVDVLRGKEGEDKCFRTNIADEVMLDNDVRWYIRYGEWQVTAQQRGIEPIMAIVQATQVIKDSSGPTDVYQVAARGTLLVGEIQSTSVMLPPEEIKRLEEQNRRHGDTLIGNYSPTQHLRWAVPDGTHLPSDTVLQQRWDAPRLGGGVSSIWKEVPRVVVKKEG